MLALFRSWPSLRSLLSSNYFVMLFPMSNHLLNSLAFTSAGFPYPAR